MKKQLAFRTIALDSHYFRSGIPVAAGSVYGYFDDDGGVSSSDDVTKQDEERTIQWILGSRARDLLLEVLEAGSDVFIDCSIRQPIVENSQSKPGDIDLLICPARRPDIAIAFQCKSVVVKSLNAEEDDDVKKLPRLQDLVIQANRQRNDYGFYRNYLAILIKVDGRRKVNYNTLLRCAGPETLKTIYEFPDREAVHHDVGIIFVEITQPTAKSFDEHVTFGVCVDREAGRLDQSPRLTRKIEELMHRRGVAPGRA
jgi:hypothetical protein